MEKTAEVKSPSLRVAWLCAAFFLVALLLRVNGLGTVSTFSGDESMHVVSAKNYTERGYFGPDNWYHPPLKHVLLYGSMQVLGNNPYGWRMRNVIFGAATVSLLFLLSVTLLGSTAAAAISASLLLLDPLHIAFSRTTFEDIPAVFFMLGGVLFSIAAFRGDRERSWVLAGTLFGLAIGTRLYCLNIIPAVIAAAFLHPSRRRGTASVPRIVAYLIILPALLYLLVYMPWFRRGYTLLEWVMMQGDAFRELRHVHSFHPALAEISGPWKWFTREVAAGFNLNDAGEWGTFIVIMNNPPVWLLVVPSLLLLFVTGLRKRSIEALLVPILFLALYLPFLIVQRPIFLYSSLCLLPFGFVAVGFAAERLLKKRAAWFAAAAAAWSFFLYPLVVGIPVPLSLYQPVLSCIKIFRPS
ncbi:MAG: hypothetical protein OHK006_06340 [Thermodesulfovibrionales bacterium]